MSDIDDVAAQVALTSGAMSKDDWIDFLNMPFPQQQAAAQLYKNAIFEAAGPSGWDTAMAIFSAAAGIAGAASGVVGAYQALRAL